MKYLFVNKQTGLFLSDFGERPDTHDERLATFTLDAESASYYTKTTHQNYEVFPWPDGMEYGFTKETA